MKILIYNGNRKLLIKENNEYIFGIVFGEDSEAKDPTWILGKPFMKKYELLYTQ